MQKLWYKFIMFYETIYSSFSIQILLFTAENRSKKQKEKKSDFIPITILTEPEAGQRFWERKYNLHYQST